MRIRTRAEHRSLLGVSLWWVVRPMGFDGSDIVYPPRFRARSLEKAEAKAIAFVKKRYARPAERVHEA